MFMGISCKDCDAKHRKPILAYRYSGNHSNSITVNSQCTQESDAKDSVKGIIKYGLTAINRNILNYQLSTYLTLCIKCYR